MSNRAIINLFIILSSMSPPLSAATFFVAKDGNGRFTSIREVTDIGTGKVIFQRWVEIER